MFEGLTYIPSTEDELSQMYNTFQTMSSELSKVIDSEKWGTVWHQNYLLLHVAGVMVKILSLSKNKSGRAVINYLDKNSYSFKNFVETTDNDYGLIINQEPSTHFSIVDYPNVTYLKAAEDHLKQSPQHFLKIFTCPLDEKLYVYTNKMLSAETFFRLLELQAALFPRENELADTLIKAFLDKDVTTFRGALVKYLTSDAVIEAQYRSFQACICSNTNKQIKKLMDNIEAERSNIAYWEQEITGSASKIRDMNENIEFLRTKHDDDEETKVVFKYLKKHPYIKQFEGRPGRAMTLLLKFEAPIIYFAELPAERYLSKDYVDATWKKIIKIMLGRKYELMTKCSLEFSTETFRITIADRELDPTPLALPHPHIVRFHCFGNHLGAVKEAAETGNYIGAFEQISQAVMNLNFYDSCVVNELLRTLSEKRHTAKVWRNKTTGEMFTTEEIIERNDYYEET